MAFAFVAGSVKVYPLVTETSFRDHYVQAVEAELTALVSDTDLKLATAAVGDVNAAGISTLLGKADKVLSYNFLESPRALAATGAAHTYDGKSDDPKFSFTGTASTPTKLTLFMLVKLSKDQQPITFG